MPWPRSLAVLVLVSPVLAQQVWNVPVGASVNTYIAQASPGDLLLLGQGGYPAFSLTKGVSVRGSGSALGQTTVAAITAQVPQGQYASVAALGITGVLSMGISGAVSFDDVRLDTNKFVVNSGNVVMQRLSGYAALEVRGGTCSVSNSTLRPLDACALCNRPTYSGLEVYGGTVTMSRCAVAGGTGDSWSLWPPANFGSREGILVVGPASVVRITDCGVWGGNSYSAGRGAAAISVGFGGQLQHARCTLVDGPNPFVPTPGNLGNPVLIGMSSSGPPTRGASFTATATAGNAQGFLAIAAGFSRAVSVLPPIVEPLYGSLGQHVVLDVALPPTGGMLTSTVSVPNVAGLQGAEVWLQAVQMAGSTIRASSVVGGTIR